MTRGFIVAAVLAALAPTAALAGVSYVHAGRLVDPEQGRVLTDQLIRIENGRVTAVTPWSGAPADGPVVDWTRYEVLPGLIDMHVHLADADETRNPSEALMHSVGEIAYIGARHARQTLMAGFTSVHDVGCFRAFADTELRDAINRGDVVGPRMSAVGAYITIPGGGGEVTGSARDVKLPDDMRVGVVTDPNDVRLKVNYLFQHGADSIKLIATGAVLAEGTEVGQQELSEDEMRAAVQTAAAHGGWVTAHAHGAEGIKSAMRAGVKAIEHASLIDDEGIALAKAKGVYLDMDVYNGDYIDEVGTRDGWPAEYLRKNRETTLAQRQGFQKAVKAGVKMTFGTDAGVYPHGLNARQFKYMVQWGMTPMQAIQAATVNSAALLGWSKDVGALSPGHYADMVAVEGDALKDITVLEHVSGVIKGGEVVKSSLSIGP
ncbi:Xaa-Pro dipeptidase [Phenylobacterium montanum]|uniref:Amidohydrolase family protein n=1 Tax=Phenylobacterium montanum TaxID=2823693 RepID=A0A975G1I8_9CAUL|nr:amidohydrolase family protein [Caulobacter sp. S6]QUD89398.1 amidohydrolase family protein [Caulobacter sp. S6]